MANEIIRPDGKSKLHKGGEFVGVYDDKGPRLLKVLRKNRNGTMECTTDMRNRKQRRAAGKSK